MGELSAQSSGERIRRELRRAPGGGITRGELAILLIDIDDDEVSVALEAELNAGRVIDGVSGPSKLTRFYLAAEAQHG